MPSPDPSRASTDATSPGFDDLGLPRKVIAALVLEDIETPTPVQQAVIPSALAGRDVLGRARTGSGKTLAFGIPIVARLAGEKSRIHRPRALIIVPTRELAGQVEKSLELVARAVKLKLTTVYGGTRYDRQIQQLRQGTDIVVATPGRLKDLIDKGVLQTDDVEITVLDEADHLCDLGFYPAVDELLSLTPEGGQRMLLSATLDGDVDRLVRKHLREPAVHEVDSSSATITTMEHHLLLVGGFHDKVGAAVALVEANPRSIVFTRTREGATDLRDAFAAAGLQAVDLHGNLSQRVRERNLEKFSTGRAQAVVATDVAARGIHVDGVEMVVHFDPPTDPKAYLHRSGRTARAGESGAVVTIVTPRQVGTVVQMQSSAGVVARHHDIRTAPRPMTAAALAESGTTAPEVRTRREHKPGASRRPYNTGRPQRGGHAGPRRDRPGRAESFQGRWERPAREDRPVRDARPARDDRPARQDRPAGSESSPRTEAGPARSKPVKAGKGPKAGPSSKVGKKARWTKSDRDRRS
jgi:superfamily II DNA/RNA helicase